MNAPRFSETLRIRTLAALAVAAVAMSACGRANTIYPSDDNRLIAIDDPAQILPAEFKDQSINSGNVNGSVWRTGASITLTVYNETLAAGAYRDSALIGNRAILSIFKYDSTALTILAISLEKRTSNPPDLKITALVDLECDGIAAPRTFTTDPIGTSVSVHDPIWSVSGAAIIDSASNTLVYSSADSTRTSLDALIAKYPKACLRNGANEADDAPAANVTMGALQLSIGSAQTVPAQIQSLELMNLKVNDDLFATWKTK